MKQVNLTNTKQMGSRVSETRKAKGLRQDDLALAAGVGPRFIGDLERGKETVQLAESLRVIGGLGFELCLSRNNELFGAIRTPKSLGEAIRGLRNSLNLRQDDLALAAGVGPRFIGELEGGKGTSELGKTLRVVQALGASLELERRK